MSESIPSPRVVSPTRSWRRTVADAVVLAQSAVELDSSNTNPLGALAAYTESVRRLRSIQARLERHGAHSDAGQLAAICEGYSERMRMLYAACKRPPPPYEYHDSGRYSSPPGLPFRLPNGDPPAYGA
ncbi:hypothetical protein B0F90DRAFT_990223 [Multifurca ochricompacta]|uniref:Uncharacterized protein n=1 Tax=Multifurca ochricompacta TaxID=376703 RepID=A0AAD4M2A5_9AGAM|nr:hypothetical protein B0F90DRAFT_990223 [Multifurca ochricompacta]